MSSPARLGGTGSDGSLVSRTSHARPRVVEKKWAARHLPGCFGHRWHLLGITPRVSTATRECIYLAVTTQPDRFYRVL